MTHDDLKANCAKLIATGKLSRDELATVRALHAARSYSRRDKETISGLMRRHIK